MAGKSEIARVKEEIGRLRTKINRHNYLYYVLDSPEITDAEFDRLLRRLEVLEAGLRAAWPR